MDKRNRLPPSSDMHIQWDGVSLYPVYLQLVQQTLLNGTLGVDYGHGTDMENWGMVTVDYADEAHTMPEERDILGG